MFRKNNSTSSSEKVQFQSIIICSVIQSLSRNLIKNVWRHGKRIMKSLERGKSLCRERLSADNAEIKRWRFARCGAIAPFCKNLWRRSRFVTNIKLENSIQYFQRYFVLGKKFLNYTYLRTKERRSRNIGISKWYISQFQLRFWAGDTFDISCYKNQLTNDFINTYMLTY